MRRARIMVAGRRACYVARKKNILFIHTLCDSVQCHTNRQVQQKMIAGLRPMLLSIIRRFRHVCLFFFCMCERRCADVSVIDKF